jgi:hypothetical protein
MTPVTDVKILAARQKTSPENVQRLLDARGSLAHSESAPRLRELLRRDEARTLR